MVTCPECGKQNANDAKACWLCRHWLEGAGESTAASPVGERVPVQFNLSGLLIVITLICVGLGLISFAPGLGVPLLVFVVAAVVPALLRSSSATRNLAEKQQVSTADKVGAFMSSLGMVLVLLAAGVGAFCVTCFATCGVAMLGEGAFRGSSGEETLIFLLMGGMVLSAIIGLAVFIVWYVKTWPKKK